MPTKYEKFMAKTPEERRAELIKQLSKTPDRVAVLVRGKPVIKQFKFLVQEERPMMDLKVIVRAKLSETHPDKFSSHTALFMFVKIQKKESESLALLPDVSMASIAQDYTWDDGFVHIEYALEDVFG